MPNPLPPMISSLVASHAFFTTYVGAGATTANKELLATKLLLYEVRGRPWDTRTRDLANFEQDCIRFDPRPQLGDARDRLVQALDRFTAREWVPGELILRRLRAFPGVYWGVRRSSGSQWGYMRDIVRAFYGQSSPVTIPPATLTEYRALRRRGNEGDANLARARLTMALNFVDLPADLPQHGLVEVPYF